MIRLRAGSATSTGQVRSNNQDAHLLAPEHDLFGVADGIGGNQGGEVASQMAVDIVSDLATERSPENLLAAVTAANRLIFERSGTDPLLHGMGTTFVAVQAMADPNLGHTVRTDTTPLDAIPPDTDGTDTDTAGTDASGIPDASDAEAAVDHPPEPPAIAAPTELCWINVGDSRVYLLRDDEIIQLSEDHSLVEELVREGTISEEEARIHPQRNIITRSLGVDRDVRADLGTIAPHRGDRVLLCSDGLSNEVSDDQMASVLRRLVDPDEAAAELVRLANEAGGRDNITVVIVDVVDDGGRSLAASDALADEPLTSGSLPGARTMRIDEDGIPVEEIPAPTDDPLDEPTADLDAVSISPAAPDTAGDDEAGEPVRVRRFTWRVFAFALILVAIAAATIGGIGWTARNTWFVRYDDTDHVALYRGKPGGLLIFQPELIETSDLERDEVAALYQADLEAGREFRSEAAASRYLQSLVHARTVSTGGDDPDDSDGSDEPADTTTTTIEVTTTTEAAPDTTAAATTTTER